MQFHNRAGGGGTAGCRHDRRTGGFPPGTADKGGADRPFYASILHNRPCRRIDIDQQQTCIGVVLYSQQSGAAGRGAGPLPHRKPDHGPRRRQKFGVSKSTVHKDLSERLPLYDRPLYLQVKAVMEENKAQRHIRGGLATRKKYKGA